MNESYFFHSRDVLCLLNPAGYFLHVNPVFCRTTGYQQEEVIQRRLLEFLHPNDCEAVRLTLNQLHHKNIIDSVECRLRYKNNTFHWFIWKLFPEHNDSSLLHICGVGMDLRDLPGRSQPTIAALPHS